MGHGGNKLYNGNISEIEWRMANTDNSLHWYRYDYDALNRLKKATDNLGKFNETLNYDKNGNITDLVRLGHIVGGTTVPNITNSQHFGTMDNLSYTYAANSNKLMKVADSANKTYGFRDGTNTGDDYAYDANGNMVSDANKGISAITYNYLNLPKDISINGSGGNGTISYIYDATGTKLRKKVVETGKPDRYTYYAGNYVYEGSSLKYFGQPEGYVDAENGFGYVYQYRDHLGNIRLSYKDVSLTSTPSLQIVEENNYYPFGLEHKGYNKGNIGSTNIALKRKFGGKELSEELGLNTYDFGARNYDASLGRWFNIDMKAEAYYPVTPYQYVLNNPIVNTDHNGQWTVTRHYNMTYNALSAAGIGKKQADLIAHYSSVYADNPGDHIKWNNRAHPTDKKYYRNDIDYSGTANSQVTAYSGKGYNYNIWHSMRSPWEKENNTITEAAAMQRGMEFGWNKIFESAESGNLNGLEKGSKGIKGLGQGLHALQDAYAHKGNGDSVGPKHLLNDRYGDLTDSKSITQTAVNVHNLLTENWGALDKTGVKLNNTEGMTKEQFSTILTQINKYLKQKDEK